MSSFSLTSEVEKFGNKWGLDVNNYFQDLLEPIHSKLVSTFSESVKVETKIQYGEGERHRLDIYSPSSATPKSALPVVVYIHGGGFTAGDNDVTPSIHGNIGRYFASNNCIGVLATYRLLPSAKFPEGAEDVAAAIRWLSKNIASYGGDGSKIFPVGQSAGGAHIATALFTGLLTPKDLKNVPGVILQSAPLWYNLKLDRRRQNMLLYHRTESNDEVEEKTSVALFKKADLSNEKDWPRLLLMVGEYDSDEIVDGQLMLVKAYRERLQKLPLLEVMRGHNHISYALNLGLAEGDNVGPRILRFLNEK